MDYDLAMKNYELALKESEKLSSTQTLIQELLNQSNQEKNTTAKTQNDNVDWNSANNLGYGPISKSKLDDLVDSGKVNATVQNGKISYNNTNNNSLASKWNRYKL